MRAGCENTVMSHAASRLAAALRHPDGSARLRAALAAGTTPDDAYLEPLIERCAVEPDFSVREMLTWALTRLSHDPVLDRVIVELRAEAPQARAQALHTASKLRDERAWAAITPEHLHDADDEVARTAWRAAVALAPFEAHADLARELRAEFGRGDLDVQRSLARAFVELGDAGAAVARAVRVGGEPGARMHAAAALRLIEDPESTFFLDPRDA